MALIDDAMTRQVILGWWVRQDEPGPGEPDLGKVLGALWGGLRFPRLLAAGDGLFSATVPQLDATVAYTRDVRGRIGLLAMEGPGSTQRPIVTRAWHAALAAAFWGRDQPWRDAVPVFGVGDLDADQRSDLMDRAATWVDGLSIRALSGPFVRTRMWCERPVAWAWLPQVSLAVVAAIGGPGTTRESVAERGAQVLDQLRMSHLTLGLLVRALEREEQ